jgi:hypothetical protein
MNPDTNDRNDDDGSRHGDAEKIDKKLDELGVGKSKSGKDQRDQPDKEGSASSSKDSEQP